MEYKQCQKCKFWVEEKTKRCSNCGSFYPTRKKSTLRGYAAKGAVVALCFGFVFSLLLLLPEANRSDPAAVFGPMAVISLVIGSILGIIIGIIYEGYLNVSKVKYMNLPFLAKDEQKIAQREKELGAKEEKVIASMEQIKQSLQLVERSTDKFEIAQKTLQSALEAIAQQRNEYKIKLWEIELMRWYNPLRPLTTKISSAKNPNREQYDLYLKELDEIRTQGNTLLFDLQELNTHNEEKSRSYFTQVETALDAINKLITEVAENRAALDVQDAVKDVSFIKDSPSSENPMLKSTIEQVSYLDALLPDLNTFSSDLEKLEEEYFRLEAEKEVENVI